MLNAQVEYWKLQETKRHNIASEDWQNASLDETRRHNLKTEQYNDDVLSENKRHNMFSEVIESNRLELDKQRLNETIRSNLVSEQIGWANAANQATQAQASLRQATVAERNASTKEREANISAFRSVNEADKIEMEREMLPYSKFQSVSSGVRWFN